MILKELWFKVKLYISTRRLSQVWYVNKPQNSLTAYRMSTDFTQIPESTELGLRAYLDGRTDASDLHILRKLQRPR